MVRLQGVTYRKSVRTKSEIFLDALPIINSGKCELLDDPILLRQLCGLQRKVAPGGRETVGKSPGNHDDIANSACGALCLAALAPQLMRHASPILVYEPLGQGGGLPPVVAPTNPYENPAAPSRPEYQSTGGDAQWLQNMSWRPKNGKWC